MTTSMHCGPLTITASFDSGNVFKAELVKSSPLPPNASLSGSSQSQSIHSSSLSPTYFQLQNHDYEINVWTRPDCQGTPFENGNRTWFYFSVNGGRPGSVVKINIINLNKQSKLFMQGMAPVFRILPEKPHWERVRDRIVLNENKSAENACSISFRQKLPDNPKQSTLFIAFTYPFSYLELCDLLKHLDSEFLNISSRCTSGGPKGRLSRKELWLPQSAENDIYYHRECVCYSLEGKRVDLLTITSVHGISERREDRLTKLFPIETEPRPFKFPGKKVVFLSARVHPGETPSSFVLNGFLRFILDKTDPRTVILRRLFVFKLIPILNPDGVSRGHYRTDPRGVNLNRVYLNPSPLLHPSIYAARKLLIYYHSGIDHEDSVENASPQKEPRASSSMESVVDEVSCSSSGEIISQCHLESDTVAYLSEDACFDANCNFPPMRQSTPIKKPYTFVLSDANSLCAGCVAQDDETAGGSVPVSSENDVNSPQGRCAQLNLSSSSIHQCAFEACDEDSVFYENLKLSDTVSVASSMEVDSLPAVTSTGSTSLPTSPKRKKKGSAKDKKNKKGSKQSLLTEVAKPKKVGAVGGKKTSKDDSVLSSILSSIKLPSESKSYRLTRSLSSASGYKSKSGSTSRYFDSSSGLFLYVDMHGHTTKRGMFMYGNHFPDVYTQAECMLVPRIMAINSHHFDFAACNFTERLMCCKDRKDGASREGSGRVACLKLTGLIRSYTLECNYNTGRIVNPVISRPANCGFLDPIEPSSFQPPKYTIELFEGIGRALAETVLDMTGQNPWSRLNSTEFKTIDGVKRSLITRLKLSPEFKSTTSVASSPDLMKKGSISSYDANPLLPTGSLKPKNTKKPKAKVLTPSQPSGPLGPRRENQNPPTNAKSSGSQKKKLRAKQLTLSSEDSIPGTSSSFGKSTSLPKSNLTKLMKKKTFPKFTSVKAKTKKSEITDVLPN